MAVVLNFISKWKKGKVILCLRKSDFLQVWSVKRWDSWRLDKCISDGINLDIYIYIEYCLYNPHYKYSCQIYERVQMVLKLSNPWTWKVQWKTLDNSLTWCWNLIWMVLMDYHGADYDGESAEYQAHQCTSIHWLANSGVICSLLCCPDSAWAVNVHHECGPGNVNGYRQGGNGSLRQTLFTSVDGPVCFCTCSLHPTQTCEEKHLSLTLVRTFILKVNSKVIDWIAA